MSRVLDQSETFSSLCTTLGLDVRLRKAIARMGFVRPTLVQSKSLPLAITSGRDLLVRARTGSGKTLAYCLPILQKLLASAPNNNSGGVKSVILVPTRELCSQVERTLKDLCYYCDEVVTVGVLMGSTAASGSKKKDHHNSKASIAAQEAMLRDQPAILVSTPAGLLVHVRSGVLDLKTSVESLVVDEADLVLSFGYADDIHEITKCLPKICQGFLMSATLSPEVNSLKKIVLHSPAVLKLEEDDEKNAGKAGQLTQFYLSLPKTDKNLVLYVFLKLGLLKGKGLFFVNTTDAGYRLKLFLEQFHIRASVLNAELPLKSRLNIIEQFNAGNFDYLIATDESSDVGGGKKKNDDSDAQNDEKQKKSKRKDSEYGVSRGLDFRNVSFVVNVDFPPSVESYTHRVGRTARGGAKGVALSLVEADSPEQIKMLAAIHEAQPKLAQTTTPSGAATELQTSTGQLSNNDDDGENPDMNNQHQSQPSPLEFDLAEIEGFRYRVEDVSRAVTKTAVKETRASELRAEILNSERLQNAFFDENKSDLQLLRHDRVATHISKVQDHLKNVPKYMLPRGMSVTEPGKRRKRRRPKTNRVAGRRTDNDPLQSFEGAVNLDGVAAGEEKETANNYEEFFETDGDDADDDGDDKKPKRTADGKIFMDTSDGTGRSTAGRNSWKEKRSRGKFSKKFQKKMRLDGGGGSATGGGGKW